MREIEGFSELKLRYLNGSKRIKGEILSSFETLYGYSRNGAIRLLNRGVNTALERRKPCKRGAKPRYQDPEFKQSLRRVWGEM